MHCEIGVQMVKSKYYEYEGRRTNYERYNLQTSDSFQTCYQIIP